MKSNQTRFRNGQRFIATLLVALMVILVPRASMATVNVTLDLSMSDSAKEGWAKLRADQEAEQAALLQAIYAYLHQTITITPADIDVYIQADRVDALYELLYNDTNSSVPIVAEQIASHSFEDYYHASCSKRERNLIIDSEFVASSRKDLVLEPQSPFTPYRHTYIDDGVMSTVFSGYIYPCENGVYGDYKERSTFDLVLDEPITIHREVTTSLHPLFKSSADSVSGSPEIILTIKSDVNTRILESPTLWDARRAVDAKSGEFDLDYVEESALGEVFDDAASKAIIYALQQTATGKAFSAMITAAIAEALSVAAAEAVSIVLAVVAVVEIVALAFDYHKLKDVDSAIEKRVNAYVRADVIKAYDEFYIPEALESLANPFATSVPWVETRVLLPKGATLNEDVLRPLLYQQHAGSMLCSVNVRDNPEGVLMLYMTGLEAWTDAIEDQEKGCMSAVMMASTSLLF